MVTAVTSLSRSGLSDWLLQRVTAVIITVYVGFIIGVFACNPGMDHAQLTALFNSTCVRIFNTLMLFSVVAHAWIGAWSVLTDYVTPRFFKLELGMELGSKAIKLRIFLQLVTILLMLVYTLWGIEIFWGF